MRSVLSEAYADRPHEPIRRNSRERGRCEAVYWRPFDPKDAPRLMLAAERFERVNRQKGKRSGPLGFVALEVLRELLRLVDYRTGRLEPALTTLMGRLHRSKDAIVTALARLRAHGFVDWLRRWEPTGANDGGPKVKQATNAYRLALPPAAVKLLGFFGRPAPEPDDSAQARTSRVEAAAAMVDGLPLDEQPAAAGLSGPLAEALSRLGRSVMRRSESPPSRQNPDQSLKLEVDAERPNGRNMIP